MADVICRIQPAKYPTPDHPNECVYRVEGDLSHGGGSECTEEQRYRATLFSASPDLYEACRESQRLVAACAREGFTVAADVEALFAHNAVLSAALAKAEGQS